MRKILSICLVLLSGVVLGHSQNVAVTDSVKMEIIAGEAQSTVVPPGKKTQCQEGRFLISNDLVRPPDGVVTGQDLDNPGTNHSSKFSMGSLATSYDTDFTKSKYWFGTNDHDLITLSNGDVLYITGAFSAMPMAKLEGKGPQKNPDWFNDSFRCFEKDSTGKCLPNKAFGPGARTVVLVFRSTDCGSTFKFVSEMDPMRVGNGSCAFPQFRYDGSKPPSLIPSAPWELGGSDGQLAVVDPSTDRVYMTFQCVGYNPVDPKATNFVLDLTKPLNKTIVMMLDPAGNMSWNNLGTIDQAVWRFGIVPTKNEELIFGYSSSILTGKKGADGKYAFDSTGIAAPNGSFSWEWEGDLKGNPNIPIGSIYANVWAVPILVRSPAANTVVLAFPDIIGSKGFGYRVYFYDRAAKKMAEGKSIVPAKASKDNVTFHLTAIYPGSGPTMLYWYDLDSAGKKITIRGRLITGKGLQTDDFTVSQAFGAARSFSLTSDDYWFGDYQTAGGFTTKTTQSTGTGPFEVDLSKTVRYTYYPMWVEPNGTINYARVQFAITTDLLAPVTKETKWITVNLDPIREMHWRPDPPPIILSRIRRPTPPILRELEFSDRRRKGIKSRP